MGFSRKKTSSSSSSSSSESSSFSTRDETILPQQLHYSCSRAHSAPGVASRLTRGAE
jgi:hypothetical protein